MHSITNMAAVMTVTAAPAVMAALRGRKYRIPETNMPIANDIMAKTGK